MIQVTRHHPLNMAREGKNQIRQGWRGEDIDYEWITDDRGLEFDCPVRGCGNPVTIIGDLCHVCKLSPSEHDTCSIPECANPSMRGTRIEGTDEYREGGITGRGSIIEGTLRFLDESGRPFLEPRDYYFFDTLKRDNYPRFQISIQQHKRLGHIWQLPSKEMEGDMCRSCFEEDHEKVRVKLSYAADFFSAKRLWVWAPKNTQSPRSNRRRRHFGPARREYDSDPTGNWGGRILGGQAGWTSL